jgi:hypothetical protein
MDGVVMYMKNNKVERVYVVFHRQKRGQRLERVCDLEKELPGFQEALEKGGKRVGVDVMRVGEETAEFIQEAASERFRPLVVDKRAENPEIVHGTQRTGSGRGSSPGELCLLYVGVLIHEHTEWHEGG